MKASDLDALEARLHRRRCEIVREVGDIDADLRFITEDRESEIESRAQEERASDVLSRLDDRARREVEDIDAALERMTSGTYGTCEDCGRPIPRARLTAVPAARLCLDCARARETPRLGEAEEPPVAGRVPPDLRLLTDRELEEHVRERIRDDGRVDMEELRVVCRRGVVHLGGAVPSESEHDILRKLVTDVIGLEDVVDRLQVAGLLWERARRSKRTAVPAERPAGTERADTEDVVESTEEGVDWVPPVGPTPDQEQ